MQECWSLIGVTELNINVNEMWYSNSALKKQLAYLLCVVMVDVYSKMQKILQNMEKKNKKGLCDAIDNWDFGAEYLTA